MLVSETPKSFVRKSIRRKTWSFVAARHSEQLQWSCVVFVPSHLGQRVGLSARRIILPQLLHAQKLCLALHAVGMELASMSKMSSAPFHPFSSIASVGLVYVPFEQKTDEGACFTRSAA